MAMLHTVNKSPFEKNSTETCLSHVKAGASILFIEDGVYAALDGTVMTDRIKSAMKDCKIYVLGPDYKARGLSEDKLIEGVTVVDYGGFVDLVTEHDSVQSWL